MIPFSLFFLHPTCLFLPQQTWHLQDLLHAFVRAINVAHLAPSHSCSSIASVFKSIVHASVLLCVPVSTCCHDTSLFQLKVFRLFALPSCNICWRVCVCGGVQCEVEGWTLSEFNTLLRMKDAAKKTSCVGSVFSQQSLTLKRHVPGGMRMHRQEFTCG